MRAAELNAFGLDGLSWAERATPRPGTGEVLVRMRAWSLNYRDLLVIRGQYNPKQKLPLVPLSDGAGEVVELGPGVTRVKAGDRVAGAFLQSWMDGEIDDSKWRGALGTAIEGVASEYRVFNEQGVVPVPEYLSLTKKPLHFPARP